MVNASNGDFIINKLQENKKNPKRFWRQINSLLSTEKDSNTYQQLLNPESDDLCVPGTESEVSNTHNATVGSKILEKHDGLEPWDYGTTRQH